MKGAIAARLAVCRVCRGHGHSAGRDRGMLWWKGGRPDERMYGMLPRCRASSRHRRLRHPHSTREPSSRRSIRLCNRGCGPAWTWTCARVRSTNRSATCGHRKSLQSERKRLDAGRYPSMSGWPSCNGRDRPSLREVQLTLEAIQPKQAKEQIMRCSAIPSRRPTIRWRTS